MKKLGFIFCLLFLSVFTYGQDRLSISDEKPEVLEVLKEAGIDTGELWRTYTEPWRELIHIRAPIIYFERLVSLGVIVEPELSSRITETPLMTAIKRDYLEAVLFFLSNGADVNRENIEKETPVFFAARSDIEILRLIINARADVNKANNYGYTPLHNAANAQRYENITLLLSHGANVNIKASDGVTPLMLAVNFITARPQTVQAILAGRPDINAVNNEGQTALIVAAKSVDHPEIISVLLNAGADVRIRDNTGRTALDWFDMNQRLNRHPVRREIFERM